MRMLGTWLTPVLQDQQVLPTAEPFLALCPPPPFWGNKRVALVFLEFVQSVDQADLESTDLACLCLPATGNKEGCYRPRLPTVFILKSNLLCPSFP